MRLRVDNINRGKEMAIEYRRLTEKEIDIFIEMRIAQLREERAKEEIDFVPYLQDYYGKHMKDGCGTVQITASDMGVQLYTAYGFEHNRNFMQYKL